MKAFTWTAALIPWRSLISSLLLGVSTEVDASDGALKRALFLFDKLALVNLNGSRLELRGKPHLRADLDWLAQHGHAVDLKSPAEEWRRHYRGYDSTGLGHIAETQQQLIDFFDHLRRRRERIRWNRSLDAKLRGRRLEAIDAVEARLIARIHAIDLSSRHGTEAVLLHSDQSRLTSEPWSLVTTPLPIDEDIPKEFERVRSLLQDTRSEETMSVTLHSFPVPTETTPLYDVIEFRRSAEVRADFDALRVWMSSTARGELRPNEIEDQLRHLINQFETHMKHARMAIGRSNVTTIAVSVAQFAEELVRFRFSKALESIGGFNRRRVALLQAESAAPGRELLYLIKARRKFGRWW